MPNHQILAGYAPDIKTQYLQLSYYRKHLNFVVNTFIVVHYVNLVVQDPIQVTLGTSYIWTGEGQSRRLTEVESTHMYQY